MTPAARTLVRAWASAAAVPLLLSACATSDVATIQGATEDQLGAVRVAEVTVARETPKPNPALEAALKAQLAKSMPLCAKGTVDHRMEVTITDFDDQNVAQTVLIGDHIELSGRVRLIDATSGVQVGEYFVEAGFFWGGLIGAAMMSNAEQRLSQDFAEEVCEQVFGVKLKTAKQ